MQVVYKYIQDVGNETKVTIKWTNHLALSVILLTLGKCMWQRVLN